MASTENKPTTHRAALPRIALALAVLAAVVATALLARVLREDGGPRSPDTQSTETVSESQPSPALAATGSLPASRSSWQELDDPTRDGWDTEAFNDQASSQLKQLGKMLAHPTNIDVAALARFADQEFSSDQLLPTRLKPVYRDDQLLVERASHATSSGAAARAPFRGQSGFAEAVRQLIRPWSGAADLRIKFKLYRVEKSGDHFATHQYVAISGATSEGFVEQNATWEIRWSRDARQPVPRIQSIDAVDFEQVSRTNPQWFSDCTAAVLGDTACYESHLLRGYGYWLERVPHGIYQEMLGTPGVAVGDVNGDALSDLYLCQERGLPNRLFLQQADGSAREVAHEWGVDWLEASRGALLVDLDNDGDQDIAVSVMGGVVLASNESGRRFEYRHLLPTTEDTMSLASADFDGDGDCDLFVCGYQRDRPLDQQGNAGNAVLPVGDAGFVHHDANTGGPNSLFRNDTRQAGDDWQFTDVTRDVGLDVNNRRFSFAAAWDDFDNDGDQDIYVANDFGRDNLYENDGGRFIDISDQANIENAATGMGITWGDYNRDGWMDVYVSNMFSAAGNRVTYQENFKPNAPSHVRTRLQRLARGNTLLTNAGNKTFRDVSATTKVEMGRWAWASQFADLNNDGWQDLLIANGHITGDDSGDL